jgi:hypothetical protein
MRAFPTLAFAAGLALAGPAPAQTVYSTPHLATGLAAASVSLDGRRYVDKGLVGVVRLAASTRDFAGETLASFSGLALDPAEWRKRADGAYSGRLFALPDSGPSRLDGKRGAVRYRQRLNALRLTFKPQAGPDLQSQAGLRTVGGFFLRDARGRPFLGRHAAEGETELDSEAVARLADGSFYVGDEYTAGLYYFSAEGRELGFIPPPAALVPAIDRDGSRTGRRDNQGPEGVAVTPDGKTLVAVLQSAPLQDAGAGGETRLNTRILVYDIGGLRTPSAPIAHYVLQLPVISRLGDGGPPDAAAAVSELLALDARHFLVLARDGAGRGGEPTAAGTPVYKAILLVSAEGATNLTGGPYETTARPAAPGGRLDPSIVPTHQAELINLLNPDQLGRFGLNLKTDPPDASTLPEKWESMALAPALDPTAPNDVLLLVGDDNDFVTARGRIDGQDFDASLEGPRGAGEIDNLILIYRLGLPARER